MMSVSAPSKAKASPKSSEALVAPTFMEASTNAPARSTTSPIEIKLTPVLTHESSVRSFARCSLISVSPCFDASVFSLPITSNLLLTGAAVSPPKITCRSVRGMVRLRIFALGPKSDPRSWGRVLSEKGGEYALWFGGRVNERDRLLDRRAGLEQEFFLVEDSGRPSWRADEFLKRCWAMAEGESRPASCFAPEFVLGLV